MIGLNSDIEEFAATQTSISLFRPIITILDDFYSSNFSLVFAVSLFLILVTFDIYGWSFYLGSFGGGEYQFITYKFYSTIN